MTHFLYPFIVAENTQGLGNRLVDAAGTNFNRMFNLLEIETGHFARLQGHDQELSCFAFSSPEGDDESRSRSQPRDETKDSGGLEEGKSP